MEQIVELTDDLIAQIVKDGKWVNEEFLKQFRDIGAKWNVETSILCFDWQEM